MEQHAGDAAGAWVGGVPLRPRAAVWGGVIPEDQATVLPWH